MLELQSHMYSFLAPSIMKEALSQEDPLGWICERVEEQNETIEDFDKRVTELRSSYSDTEGKPVYWEPLIETLVECAVDFGATTNDARKFYLDEWTEISWCSEEEYLAWYS